mmetsp:Transcript_6140/g.8935  ORF Transcript_6140/g.8935 Transcript_6140/m.8935 type:complete len:507 (-) Transcript_6140:21-1541(-)
MSTNTNNTKAYLSIAHGNETLGTIQFNLFSKSNPITVKNFTTLLQRSTPNGYRNSKFHRLISNFMIQGGDFTRNDGTGGKSIYGNSFDDENFIHGHDERGKLCMANSGPNTNGSQFYITFRPLPHLDGKHVVFGTVDRSDGGESINTLHKLEKVNVDRRRGDRPVMDLSIVDCGLVKEESVSETNNVRPTDKKIKDDDHLDVDEDEIDLDDDCDDDDDDEKDDEEECIAKDKEGNDTKSGIAFVNQSQVNLEANSEDKQDERNLNEDTTIKPKGKKAKLQERLRKLRLKMNQSRQLNRKEVLSEGERLGSKEGAARYKKEMSQKQKARKDEEWKSVNSKALSLGSVEMAQSSSDSIRKAHAKAEKQENNRFSVQDYYNPEGQFRNYERSLKSLKGDEHSIAHHSINDTTNKIHISEEEYYQNGGETKATLARAEQNEREGARRLASELKRRADKADARKRKKGNEFDALDVSYINQRNKRFNEKINRNYDKHTAEIRQNLERGTAL